jgi:flagellar protein FlaG
METKATAVAPVPDPKASKFQPEAPVARKGAETPPVVPAQDPVALRLVIDLDQASGGYVYKTINRLTGEVVSQLPRAEVLKLREGGSEPGAVISTEA